MPDIEKVLCGLERCLKKTCPSIYSKEYEECEYTTGLYCRQDKLLSDAYELLKEKEPVEAEIEGGGSSWWYVCGECHGTIDKWDSYCKHCGRRVKKDG